MCKSVECIFQISQVSLDLRKICTGNIFLQTKQKVLFYSLEHNKQAVEDTFIVYVHIFNNYNYVQGVHNGPGHHDTFWMGEGINNVRQRPSNTCYISYKGWQYFSQFRKERKHKIVYSKPIFLTKNIKNL